MSDSTEIWHVRMREGAVRAMTLDELDAAFDAGVVDEGTFVRRQGEASWARLGALLGLDAPASSPPPQVIVAPTPSLRPVVSEIDPGELDWNEAPLRPSRKRAVVVGGVAGAALLAIAVVFAASGDKPAPVAAKSPPVSVAAASPPPPPPAPVAAPDPTPAPDRLSDAQRRALADADKALAAKQKAKASAPPPAHKSTYKSSGKPVFHKGGNQYDPLNSKI